MGKDKVEAGLVFTAGEEAKGIGESHVPPAERHLCRTTLYKRTIPGSSWKADPIRSVWVGLRCHVLTSSWVIQMLLIYGPPLSGQTREDITSPFPAQHTVPLHRPPKSEGAGRWPKSPWKRRVSASEIERIPASAILWGQNPVLRVRYEWELPIRVPVYAQAVPKQDWK